MPFSIKKYPVWEKGMAMKNNTAISAAYEMQIAFNYNNLGYLINGMLVGYIKNKIKKASEAYKYIREISCNKMISKCMNWGKHDFSYGSYANNRKRKRVCLSSDS